VKLTLTLEEIKEIVEKNLITRGYDVKQVKMYWFGTADEKPPWIEATITKP
jgi:N-methylhydantoinase A/oxoprolinase/acetone carboxylase beta subunit